MWYQWPYLLPGGRQLPQKSSSLSPLLLSTLALTQTQTIQTQTIGVVGLPHHPCGNECLTCTSKPWDPASCVGRSKLSQASSWLGQSKAYRWFKSCNIGSWCQASSIVHADLTFSRLVCYFSAELNQLLLFEPKRQSSQEWPFCTFHWPETMTPAAVGGILATLKSLKLQP